MRIDTRLKILQMIIFGKKLIIKFHIDLQKLLS